MSLKTKLTSLITTFVLLCSLLTVGVFAVKNTTFNVGGDIVFNVQGIEATITRGATAGFTADKTIGDAAGNILSNIELNNDMTAKSGADNYLDISAIASATTKNNARVSVANDAGGVTALLQPQQSASFTITFSVIDDEYSASLNGFSVNFDMQKKVLADFPKVESIENEEDLLDQYEFSEFSTSAPYTVAIAAKGASAAGDDGSDYTSTLSGDIVVPSYVNKDGVVYAVTKLADGAFGYGPPGIVFDCTSLTLPKTLKTFGSYCIYTTNPLSIEIPYGVTSIGDSAFYDGEIASITIPDTVTSIGSDAFCQCYSLTSITIPDSVTSIGDGAFYGCDDLTSITIPGSVTSMGGEAFSCCSSLVTVTIGKGLTSIGDSAFYDCTSLTSVTIPNSVTSIEAAAFCNCADLTTIEIPDSVTSIGSEAFSGCTSLTSIVIPDGVTSLEEITFSGCRNLTEVTIGDSVTSIGDSAFSGCTGLTTITIGKGVASIGVEVFANCDNLTSIVVEEGNAIYDSRNNCNAIIETATNTLILGSKNTIIPNTVEAIADYAFNGSGLTSITIPSSVKSIGYAAFSHCSNLATIKISEGVTNIGEYAFSNCSSLITVTIPSSVTSIESSTFYSCTGLTSVTIPTSVTSIDTSAFSGCTGLTTVNYRGTQEQWNTIIIWSDNNYLKNANKVFNYTGV